MKGPEGIQVVAVPENVHTVALVRPDGSVYHLDITRWVQVLADINSEKAVSAAVAKAFYNCASKRLVTVNP